MKALFVANFNSFHLQFNMPYVRHLSDLGFKVSLVSGGENVYEGIDKHYNIAFSRKPWSFKNIRSFFKLRKVFSEYYDIIYFSTSVVGSFGRLALIGKKRGRVIYSAHGYNFYSVSGKECGKIFIPVERLLAKVCDCIFTMNEEDYQATLRYGIKCKEVYNLPGVGINTKRFQKLDASEKKLLRERAGFNPDSFILFYAAELTSRKNQIVLFPVIKRLVERGLNVQLLLAGSGALENKYKTIVKDMGLEQYVSFLGFRRDVPNLLSLSDVLFASSLTEGLPINMIEGLASGLPVVATKVRGHVDLIEEGKNGFLFDPSDSGKASQDIERLVLDNKLYQAMSSNARSSAQKYDIEEVLPQYDKVWGI